MSSSTCCDNFKIYCFFWQYKKNSTFIKKYIFTHIFNKYIYIFYPLPKIPFDFFSSRRVLLRRRTMGYHPTFIQSPWASFHQIHIVWISFVHPPSGVYTKSILSSAWLDRLIFQWRIAPLYNGWMRIEKWIHVNSLSNINIFYRKCHYLKNI